MKRNAFLALCMGASLAMPGITSCKQQAAEKTGEDMLTMIVGSYAPAQEEGIRLFAFNQRTGQMDSIGGVKGIENPSFLIVTDDHRRIYAVGENGSHNSTAHLIAYDGDNHTLTVCDTQRVEGAAPCHVALTPDNTHLLTANYNGGSVSALAIGKDGRLEPPTVAQFSGSGPDSTRQEQAHLHYIYFSPDGRYLMANDLGSDCIRMFPLEKGCEALSDTAVWTQATLEPGSGPRHATWNKTGNRLYVIDELKGDVVVMGYADGKLSQLQSIQADTVGARGSADIHLSPDGRHLYASNRLQADGIAIFSVDEATGLITRIGYQPTGPHPRNFAISPNGRFVVVACRDNNRIEVYSRNEQTGLLTPTGEGAEMKRPVVVKMW